MDECTVAYFDYNTPEYSVGRLKYATTIINRYGHEQSSLVDIGCGTGNTLEFMENHSLDAGYGDIVYIDQNNTNHVTRFWKAGEYKRRAFYYGWVIAHPTFFHRKEIFEKYGYFNEIFQVAADFELTLRFIEKRQITVGYLPKVIAKMRVGGQANVLRRTIRGNWEIVKSFRLNPCFSP